MINLTDIPSKQLAKILTLIRKKEEIEHQIMKELDAAKKSPNKASAIIRTLRIPRNAQPSLNEMISEILRNSDRPMSVSQIYEKTLASGYRWRSQEPLNALNVKMYTDPAFKKVAPGRFVLRDK